MDADEFVRTHPESEWPEFLKVAKQAAEREGITIKQLLDRDRKAVRELRDVSEEGE